jgi:ferredoxin
MDRIVADTKRCIGSGLCSGTAPSVFDLSAEGVVIVKRMHPEPEELDRVIDAVALCPVQALTLERENPT